MSPPPTLNALLSTLLCAPALVSAAAHPKQTASPVALEFTPSKTFNHRRQILSSIEASVESDVASLLSGLGTNLPTWVASGVEPYFQGLPTGDAVLSSLGIQSSELAAVPTNVLNISPYGNWTDAGWNVRFHGNVYKQPNTSVADLNRLANGFLNTSITSLTPAEQDMARNLTGEIYVVQQGNVVLGSLHMEPTPMSNTTGGTQDTIFPYNTTAEGDFDAFIPIASNGLLAGNATNQIQELNTYVSGASWGNATAYLVPPTGMTIISDIDDILRVTKIYEPTLGLNNTFVLPFTPWQNMPSIYANWSTKIPDLHFHYLTTTPEMATRPYMQYIYNTYPSGSFDTRPLNFSNVAETLSVRKYLLEKIFQTFPQRKFILVADTSNSDVMSDYPAMATEFPGQVACIFLRNTSATDSGDKFPYDTSGFKNLNQSQYMFFVNADDLTNLDIANGQCYNKSVAQNLTFGYQGLPFSSTAAVNASATHTASAAAGRLRGMGEGAVVWQGALVCLVTAFVAGVGLLW